MSIFGSLAAGVGSQVLGSVAQGAAGGVFAGWRMRQQRKIQKQLMDYQAGIQDRQATTAYNRQVEQWQREADWNSVGSKMSRAVQAGLSPMAGVDGGAAAQQGAASAVSAGPGGPSNPGVSQPSNPAAPAGLDPLSISRMQNERTMTEAQSDYYHAMAYKIRGYEEQESRALQGMYNSQALSNESRAALDNWTLAYNRSVESSNKAKAKADADAAVKQLEILSEKLTQEVFYSTTMQPQEYQNLRAGYAEALARTALLYADTRLKNAMSRLTAAQQEEVIQQTARLMLENKELENLLPISEARGKRASESVKLELRQKRHSAFRDLMIGIREGTGAAKDIFDIALGVITRGGSRVGSTAAPSPMIVKPDQQSVAGLPKMVSFGDQLSASRP
ncbi:DNA pilot protein [Dipodfec virus RodF1_49]|uniref:DNA pilot protein n=1 Tax=Dipodfec virus RodF1_49 TaxID=2929299 RepID=A0A976R5K6_9VIRU|nr:DNA pilot protein [Dipodfec virus RodF1_49]